jgi:type II secretory pathway pseudopilin PulG
MSTRRGATIIEILVGLIMVVVLTFAATSLYGFSVNRVMADTSQTAVYAQASSLADELTDVISLSTNCVTVTSGTVTGLKCSYPDTGTDKDGDGVFDTVQPSSVSALGTETFNVGKYIWFYMSDSTGTWGTVGTYMWRAKPTTSANPIAGDLDANWAKYYGGAGRWNLIDSVSFSVDATNHCTTFTINASSLNRAERSASAETSTSNNSKLSITRTVFWRSYR